MHIATRHWLFGYGSLINAESRALSFHCNASRLVRVRGFRRGWFHAEHDQALSGIVATPSTDSAHLINGVLIQLDADQLQHADARELPFGYLREEVDKRALHIEGDPLTADDRVWIYVVPDVEDGHTSVIYQSYLDVILAGCLDIGEEFAREFLATTALWHAAWIDDRDNPVYERAMAPGPVLERIDRMLRTALPAAYAARRVRNNGAGPR